MLFDNGIFWLVVIILTVTAAVLFGIYNRQDETVEKKDKVLLILGWVFLGIDLLIFGFGFIQAIDIKKSARRIGLDTKQI